MSLARIVLVWVTAFACMSVNRLPAAGGTSKVADAGHDAYGSPGWPKGAADLVNDSRRTNGWNDWFSGWPSDVKHYEYEIRSMQDVNALIEKLAAIPERRGCIVLSPLKEPRGLGWVTSLPEGNGIAVLFSLGDQEQVDRWHLRLPDGKFGVMQFTSCPIAVPPTLTVFVGNPLVDLNALNFPVGVAVTEGYVPLHFAKWNTKRELDTAAATKAKPAVPVAPPDVEDASRRIKVFLEAHALKAQPNN